jgi:hypothetical protein
MLQLSICCKTDNILLNALIGICEVMRDNNDNMIKRLSISIVLLVLLSVPLSVVPAAWLAEEGYISSDLLRVYSPLVSLWKMVQPADQMPYSLHYVAAANGWRLYLARERLKQVSGEERKMRDAPVKVGRE